jgi:hypothetical protein
VALAVKAVRAAVREVQAADTDTVVVEKVVPVVGVVMATVVDTAVGIEDVDDAPTLTGSPNPDE